ncbi:MAG: UTP--glucose-1-phosphate uridylyltransferase, partial [Acutalibacter sp.]|nr:UTP--glucose-1-phosphate uridylyltransferase [Acutalibacter sp.]
LKVEPLEQGRFRCTDMVEKPAPGQEFSLYSILGRCVLPPDIFDILDQTPPGAGGEIQLTDAMKALARRESMIAVDFTGRRYDMGSKLGVMQAGVEVALNHPEIGPAFRAYLKELAKAL